MITLKTLISSFCLMLLFAASVSADLLVLQNGKQLKIKEYAVEGRNVHVTINDRSDMVIPLNWVKEIRDTPDEPEPAVAEIRPASTSDAPNFAYVDLVRETARKHHVDWRLVTAVMAAESNFNPKALSPKGAQGLMQLMPATAKLFSVADPFDPSQNVEAGVRYLGMLLKRYKGKLEWALAAYNSGPQKVDQYRGIPPYAETKEYIRRVLNYYRKLAPV